MLLSIYRLQNFDGWKLFYSENNLILINFYSSYSNINSEFCKEVYKYIRNLKNGEYISFKDIDFTYSIGIHIILSYYKTESNIKSSIDIYNDTSGKLIGILNFNKITYIKDQNIWEMQSLKLM